MMHKIKSKIFNRNFEFKFNEKYLSDSPHSISWSLIYLWSEEKNSYIAIYDKSGYAVGAYTENEATKKIQAYYNSLVKQTKK